MKVFDDFYTGRRVLITGHTGFKGGWLSLWLQKLGASVYGYSLPPPTNPNLFEIADVDDGMETTIGDVRDFSALRDAITGYKPEIIMHLAAQPLVRDSYDDPVETYSTNVMGTVHVLEMARCEPSVRVVLIVTSDKCYENKEWVWGYREHEPMGGHDPYSSSKGCAELVTSAYRRSFFDLRNENQVGIASARAGNVIGGGDWAKDRIVVDAVRAFSKGMPLRVRNPGASRPWQHVLDPLCGYLTLCKRLYEEPGAFSDAWNFGPENTDTRSVADIADSVTELWGEGASWRTDQKDHPHEAHHLKLDCSKAIAMLGWRPVWNLDNTLKNTIDWYRTYFNARTNMKDYTFRQIESYERELEKLR